MLMVIFGAGASFGSAPPQPKPTLNEKWRPPLTAHLFDPTYGDVADKYPASRPAIVRMQRALAEHPDALIETEIGKLGEEAAGNPEKARHLLGLRFYLNDLIESRISEWWKRLHGFTFYGDLLERLGTWRYQTDEEIALVTFNYDELLDFSLSGQIGNGPFGDFQEYIDRPHWRLYKLHGSTSWARVLQARVGSDFGIPSVSETIAKGDGLDFEDGVLRARPWRKALEAHEDPTTTVAAPGIAIPTNQKQTFSCPADHVQCFAEDAEKTDRMLVIGWRGSEPHVLEVLSERLPLVRQLAVADTTREKSAAVLDTLEDGGVSTNFRAPLEGGFRGLLKTDSEWVLEKWLES
jgi:hypothetical protein